MNSDRRVDVIPLHPVDHAGVGGPVVTPHPVPADDMVLKLALAAAAGALLGSLVAYRWLRPRISLQRR